MGLRDWVFGRDESALDDANRLRGAATTEPDAVDVDRLVATYADAGQHDVARAAAKGIEALGERRPDRLADHVPALLDAIDALDGVGANERGRVATAVRRVAEEAPDSVAAEGDAIVATLQRELDADEEVGNGHHLDEGKATALAGAVTAAGIEAAEPVLKRLRRHSDPAVSDAARDAIRKL